MIFPHSINKRAARGASWTARYRTACAGVIAIAALSAGCAPLSQLKIKLEKMIAASNPASCPTPPSAVRAVLIEDRKTTASEPVSCPTPRNAAQDALDEGIELYDKGNFRGAITHLSKASEIWSADNEVQKEALKYMAFSYCITSRRTLCKKRFEKALKLDPAFDLAPGEKGHPHWGPVFARAKKQSDFKRKQLVKRERQLRIANTTRNIKQSNL
jgi:tetratricopeptide (TPR) repeat protein